MTILDVRGLLRRVPRLSWPVNQLCTWLLSHTVSATNRNIDDIGTLGWGPHSIGGAF
jgi:hypothetical protein